MGRVVDQIEAKATILHEIPSLITNDAFMMSWFREFEEELPPFSTYTSFIHNTKQQHSVVRDSTKHLPYKHLRNELFNPQDPSNIESDFLMEAHGTVVAETLLSELNHKIKATRNHLSSAGDIFSWTKAMEEEKLAGIGIKANNDVAGSVFGGLTHDLEKSSMIKLSSAGGLAMTRQNRDFDTTITHARRKCWVLNYYR